MMININKNYLYKLRDDYNVQLLYVSGSRLYGINRSDSDYDVRGFYLPDDKQLLGITPEVVLKQKKDELDINLFGMRHYVKSLIDNQPNVLESLFLPNDMIIYKTNVYDTLRSSRDMFISKLFITKALGYSQSEWSRVTGENPSGLGTKRKSEYEKYGYCLTVASNSIRLLFQAINLCETKELHFPVPEYESLLSIRTGEWTLESLTELRDELVGKLKESESKSKLLDRCDANKIWQWYITIVRSLLCQQESL